MTNGKPTHKKRTRRQASVLPTGTAGLKPVYAITYIYIKRTLFGTKSFIWMLFSQYVPYMYLVILYSLFNKYHRLYLIFFFYFEPWNISGFNEAGRDYLLMKYDIFPWS